MLRYELYGDRVLLARTSTLCSSCGSSSPVSTVFWTCVLLCVGHVDTAQDPRRKGQRTFSTLIVYLYAGGRVRSRRYHEVPTRKVYTQYSCIHSFPDG